MKHVCHCGMDLDIDLASQVQQLLFPKSSPVCSWCCMGVKNRMARGLGGDYFEFITLPDGCQLIFVGDVTGHGLQASVVMSLLYGFIHHTSISKCVPLDTVAQINTFLESFAQRSEQFDHYFSTTLFYAVLHPDTLEMHYINAGHVAPMVRRKDRIFHLGSTTQPLGFFETIKLEMNTFRFDQQDRFLLYTDGITEAFNIEGHIFGQRRLEQVLRQHDGDHLEFLDVLFEQLKMFGVSDPPEDDCTAIVIDFHGL